MRISSRFNPAATFATIKNILGYVDTDLTPLGITQSDQDVTLGEVSWLASDRHQVTRTLEALVHGTLAAEGIGQIEVPTEYIAGVIAASVHPCNQRKACIWLQDYGQVGKPANELSAGSVMEPVKADQLFSLVVLANTDEQTGAYRQQLASRMNVALSKPGTVTTTPTKKGS